MQKHNQYHSNTDPINSQSAWSHSNLQMELMNIGCITLYLIYIKYYMEIDVNILKWIMILLDIIVHILIYDSAVNVLLFSNVQMICYSGDFNRNPYDKNTLHFLYGNLQGNTYHEYEPECLKFFFRTISCSLSYKTRYHICWIPYSVRRLKIFILSKRSLHT